MREANAIVQIPDSGYIISGAFGNINDDEDAFYRLDKYGNVIWSKRFNPSNFNDKGETIILTQNNEIIANGKGTIYRFDLNGNIKFIKKIFWSNQNSSNSQDIDETNVMENQNGDLYFTYGEHIAKLGPSGNIKWIKRFEPSHININWGNKSLCLSQIHELSNGNLIVTGTSANYITQQDILQMCIDTAGTIIWSKIFYTDAIERNTRSLKIDDKIYMFYQYDDYLYNDLGIGIICTDSVGNQLWSKLISINCSNMAYPITVYKKKDETILVHASVYYNSSNFSNHTIQIHKDGSIINAFKLDPLAMDLTGAPTMDNGFVILSNQQVLKTLIKIGPNLNSSCVTNTVVPLNIKSCLLEEMAISNFQITNNFTSTSLNLASSNFTILPSNICNTYCATQASFISNTGRICSNNSIYFTNNSINFSSNIWKVNGVAISTSTNFNHYFTNQGTYTITLNVNGTCQDSISKVVQVDGIPDISFSLNKKDLFVRFNPDSIPNNVLFSWDFGDGSPIDFYHDSVWHSYKETGKYTVCLKSKNECGSKQSCISINLGADVSYQFYKNIIPSSFNYAIVQSGDGGFYVAGNSGSVAFIRKLDTAANHIWTSNNVSAYLSASSIRNLSLAYDNGVFFNGAATSNATSNNHMFGKIDTSYKCWHNMFPASTNDPIGNSIELNDERILFTGGRYSKGYIYEVKNNGCKLSYKEYSAFKAIISIGKTSDNSIFLFGPGAMNNQLILMKLSSNLNHLWTKSISVNNLDMSPYDMKISKNGKIYILAEIDINLSTSEPLIICTDTSGNTLWSKSYNISHYPNNMVVTKKGDLIFSTTSPLLLNTGFVVHTDSIGNVSSAWKPLNCPFRISLTHDNGVVMTDANDGLVKTDSTYNPISCNGTYTSVTTSTFVSTSINIANIVTAPNPNFSNFTTFTSYTVPISSQCNSLATPLSASFSLNAPCVGSPININNLSSGIITTYQWSFQSGSPATSTVSNPNVTWLNTGTYSVGLVVSGPAGNSTYTQMITIYPNPTINAVVSPTIACAGLNMTLTANGGVNYNWSTNQIASSIVVNPTVSTNYLIVGFDINGCSDSTYVLANVNPSPAISVNSGAICLGNSFTLNPMGASNYTFNPTGPIVTPTISSIYTISATNSLGCTGYVSSNVIVHPIPIVSANSGTICIGQNYTVFPSGADFYTINGNNFTVTPTSSTIYSVNGTNYAGCASASPAIVTISVNPAPIPTISVNSGTICKGSSYTISPSGANSFSITGNNFVVTPSITTSYSVTGTNTAGCIASSVSVISVSVFPTPTISSNSGTICSGNLFTIIPSGAINYTFSGGNPVSPTTTTSYSVTGSNSFGCINLNNAISTVTVFNLPNVSIFLTDTLICISQQSTLSATGASTYSWSPIIPLNGVVSPSTTTTYTVIGTDGNGCSKMAAITLSVDACLGFSNKESNINFRVFPIPSKGIFTLYLDYFDSDTEYLILDALGKLLLQNRISSNTTQVDLSEHPNGVYFLKLKESSNQRIIKLIKE